MKTVGKAQWRRHTVGKAQCGKDAVEKTIDTQWERHSGEGDSAVERHTGGKDGV